MPDQGRLIYGMCCRKKNHAPLFILIGYGYGVNLVPVTHIASQVKQHGCCSGLDLGRLLLHYWNSKDVSEEQPVHQIILHHWTQSTYAFQAGHHPAHTLSTRESLPGIQKKEMFILKGQKTQYVFGCNIPSSQMPSQYWKKGVCVCVCVCACVRARVCALPCVFYDSPKASKRMAWGSVCPLPICYRSYNKHHISTML